MRRIKTLNRTVCAIALITAGTAFAGVLPEERADVMYHSYSGGGVDINGPSILVRQNYSDFSFSVNVYQDNISSASIDVESYASPYTEHRQEETLTIDYLHDNSNFSIGHTHSAESDYLANTTYFSFSQTFFGDLSTISLAYSQGDDVIGKSKSPEFKEYATRENFRLSFSQVVTKNLVLSSVVETIADEGYLHNPYREVRYLDPGVDRGWSTQDEVYPRTHASDAAALRAMYYLPWKDSIRLEVRGFSDSWGIKAHNTEIRYINTRDMANGNKLIIEGKLRQYVQTHADFYSDLYSQKDAQNFLGRDKELSAFQSKTLGIGSSYIFKNLNWHVVKDFSVNLYVDYVKYTYDDFRDIRPVDNVFKPVNTEPAYAYNAYIIRLFASAWF